MSHISEGGSANVTCLREEKLMSPMSEGGSANVSYV